MLRKILKWIGGTIGVMLALILILYFVMRMRVNSKRDKIYNVEVRMIDIPADSATIAYGAHIYAIKGCSDCHGENLAGKVFLDDPAIGLVAASNLTHGKGGIPADFTDRDWLRAMRHGLRKDGRSLLIMPSYEFSRFDDHDMASLIAFCKSQPAVDNELPVFKLGPVGTILAGVGKLPLIPAEMVDHHYRQTAKVERAVSVQYGQYLANACSGCHKPDYKGGDNPIPGGKPVVDITASGNIGKWTLGEFVAALRTGNTPEGKQLKNADMPWQMTNNYTDEELHALFLYLKSI